MDRVKDSVAASGPTALRVPWTLIALASVGCGTAVALVAVPGVRATTSVSSATAVVEGVARGAMAAIPVAVALYACRRRAQARFGKLLLGFSGVWFLALLSSSSSPLVYSLGRLAGWVSSAFLAFLILAFPSGRMVSRVDRALAIAAAAAVAFLDVPSALLVERYPTPSPYASCDARCPHNAFMVTVHQPAFISGIVAPLRDALIILITVLVAARLAQRIRGVNTLVRLTVVPVLVASIAWVLLLAFGLTARRIAPASVITHAVAWMVAFAIPAIALAFLLGMAR